MAGKNWIAGAIKHKGALTKKAKAAGKSVAGFMKSPGKKVSGKTKKQINLAKTLKGLRKK